MKENKSRKLFEILNTIADWILRVIIINFLVITFMLPIITIIPALTAGYKIFSDAINKDEHPIFVGFFKYFKEAFTNKLIISIIVAIILAVSIYNNQLYAGLIKESPSLLYSGGYYITLMIIIATLMVSLYLPLVFIERKELELQEIVKLAFYMSGKYFLRTILITLTLLIPYLMFTTSFTILLFVFCGVSIPLLLNALITNKPRKYLQSMEGKL